MLEGDQRGVEEGASLAKLCVLITDSAHKHLMGRSKTADLLKWFDVLGGNWAYFLGFALLVKGSEKNNIFNLLYEFG